MEYDFKAIEQKWQKRWKDEKIYKVSEDSNKEKFYVLDMFPYPSGAGLHVGHPLGYIASDIYARYKRHQGYNVLHPMGYDSFGLPAEQYAIETGQHPAITTENNIARYREQLDKIGFCYDWDREVRTSDPNYYRWTQWIFKEMYSAWYNLDTNKAESIDTLIAKFKENGTYNVNASVDEDWWKQLNLDDFHFGEYFAGEFTATDWESMNSGQQEAVLMQFRMAYLADSWVNWCPALGTVLANDEVKDGASERGGHPVEQKLMKQWMMRITAYADRLLNDLEGVDWSSAIKDIQTNWIGKSNGASVTFEVAESDEKISVFTTRPDTIFGVSFVVLAPELEMVNKITTAAQKDEVEKYKKQAAAKTERDRQSDVKNITGAFTGAYAVHPFTGDKIQIWIGDYVLAGYGTGAVMAVPSGDQRDYDFAKQFGIDIPAICEGIDISEKADATKDAKMINSDFLNGLTGHEAMVKAIEAIEEKNIGKGKVNFRLRDAVFSRQRYWGEPFPVYYENGSPQLFDGTEPVTLPEVDKYLPTEDGDPPLARAKKEDWNRSAGERMEYNTMPGWAGSSWYFLRYMDPKNDGEFVAKEKADYWGQVDLYIGGAEHGTGHLLYSRFWTKVLFDLGHIGINEPFQKMINQGMILGRSSFVYRIKDSNKFVTFEERKNHQTQKLHVDVNIVQNDILDIEAFKNWRSEYANAEFILNEKGEYKCGSDVEKMSKRWYNVVNPDDLCDRYGADTLRCYEMFLGPLEQFKPWDTAGISGVHNFLRKLWRLSHDRDNNFVVTDGEPDKKALKTLHKTIKKIGEDLDRYSWNTVVSALMICVNELTEQKCNNKAIISDLAVILSPYAPHIAEELWHKLGNSTNVVNESWPVYNPAFLKEDDFEYPVSFNGKMRFKMSLPSDMDKAEVEKTVLASPEAQKYLEGNPPKKVIVVPKRIVNIVM